MKLYIYSEIVKYRKSVAMRVNYINEKHVYRHTNLGMRISPYLTLHYHESYQCSKLLAGSESWSRCNLLTVPRALVAFDMVNKISLVALYVFITF